MVPVYKLQINRNQTLKYLLHLQISYNFHPYFWNYKHTFFSNTYSIIGISGITIRLTHADTDRGNMIFYPLKTKHNKRDRKYCKTKMLKSDNVYSLVRHLINKRRLRGRRRTAMKYFKSYYFYLRSNIVKLKSNPYSRFIYWFKFNFKKLRFWHKTKKPKSRIKSIRRRIIRNLIRKPSTLGTKKSITLVLEVNVKPLVYLASFSNQPKVNKPLKALQKKSIMNKFLISSKYSYPKYRFRYKKSIIKTNFYTKFTISKYKITTTKSQFTWGTSRNEHLIYSLLRYMTKTKKLIIPRYNFQDIFTKVSLKKVYTPNAMLNFRSKSLNTFMLRNSGLYALTKKNWNNQTNLNFKSQFKKKLFSFVFPGELKKNILLKRKKQTLTRLLSKTTKLVKSVDRFTYTILHHIFQIKNTTLRKNNLHTSSTTSKSYNNLSYNLKVPNIYYDFDFQTKGADVGDFYVYNEVRIRRVRFKPGYQRIWRNVRSAIKTALNVKFQYQHQLTKYLVKFYHLSSRYLLSYSESTLDKVIMYSQLLPDLATVQLFSNNGYIYVNGLIRDSVSFIVIKNDFIQLVVSIWYYIISKWFLNWTNLRIRKFRRLVYRKNKPLRYKVMKMKKNKSYYTPNWIDQMRYDNTDIKSYLEVDFFTLSLFVINDTYLQYYHKLDDMPDLRNTTYMLYNWKYIT